MGRMLLLDGGGFKATAIPMKDEPHSSRWIVGTRILAVAVLPLSVPSLKSYLLFAVLKGLFP